jgi:Mlc titration factor MtfA (ptsG expression regulator)
MDPRAWTAAFKQAFEACCKQLDKGDELVIDPYAATSPAEFFAVMSEAFFVKPCAIQQYFPQVYQQLSAFYRQNPAMRWPTGVNL